MGNLLIFTQIVDQNDPVLGFFHRWIIELAKKYPAVIVVGLHVGSYNLPANVKVISLGKESGPSRLKYICNFFSYIFKFKKEYDYVFIHQNQEYAILGGFFWKFLGKKVYMWRNHYAGSFFTDIAAFFCDKVFCTSKYSYTAKYRKTVFMPVGIDVDVFKSDSNSSRVPSSILSLGRIAPSKKLEQLIEVLGILYKQHVQFTTSICGNTSLQDEQYKLQLKEKSKELGIENNVIFENGVPNDQTPEIYSAHDIFVNLSPSGMFDKTIFEAMACETLAISCNKNLEGQIDTRLLFTENNVQELAGKLLQVLSMNREERTILGRTLREFTITHHSLALLANRLKEEMI